MPHKASQKQVNKTNSTVSARFTAAHTPTGTSSAITGHYSTGQKGTAVMQVTNGAVVDLLAITGNSTSLTVCTTPGAAWQRNLRYGDVTPIIVEKPRCGRL